MLGKCTDRSIRNQAGEDPEGAPSRQSSQECYADQRLMRICGEKEENMRRKWSEVV